MLAVAIRALTLKQRTVVREDVAKGTARRPRWSPTVASHTERADGQIEHLATVAARR
jgi:hypothetical protein